MNQLSVDGDFAGPAKVSYAVRRLVEARFGLTRPVRVSARERHPRRGDVVLCEVTEVGQHKLLFQRHDARSRLFAGDRVLVAYGARYAPDQFEAELPTDLGPCDLASPGGLAARVVARHSRMNPPTTLRPLGLLIEESGAVVNTRDLALPPAPRPVRRPPVLAVVGTSMNAGKTTVVASLARGLAAAGLRVGAAKVTGTGAPADPTEIAAAGAASVIDFTDLGYPSTYQLESAEVVGIMRESIAQLANEDCEVILLEIADGILQRETARLLATVEFQEDVDRIVFAAPDSVSGVAGVRMLRESGFDVAALGGWICSSPLAMNEAARSLDIPVLRMSDLWQAQTAVGLAPRVKPLAGAR